MNDIFKLFKKRAQSGKATNITDVIKDLNEKEQNEIIGAEGVGKFERGSKSYLSISKSGRLKSKKSTSSRALQDDLFNPVSSKLAEIASRENNQNHISNLNGGITYRNNIGISSKARPNTYDHHHVSSSQSPAHKPVYDQNSDNADSSRTSSTSSSFRSSIEDISKPHLNSANHNTNKFVSSAFNSKSQIIKKQAPLGFNQQQHSFYNQSTLNMTSRPSNVNASGLNSSSVIRSGIRYTGGGLNAVNSKSNGYQSNNNAFKRF